IGRAAFAGRTSPRVINGVRSFCGIALVGISSHGIGRHQELEAFRIGGWRAGTAGVHVSASEPLRAGSKANLVSVAIVTHHLAQGKCAVTVRINRRGRVLAGGIMPVVVMLNFGAVPSAITSLE